MFQYSTIAKRAQRTLLTIAFLYLLLNGSAFNVANGVRATSVALIGGQDIFWTAIGFAGLAAGVLALGAFMVRRWQLARTQTNIPILASMTLALVLIMGIAAAIVGRWLGFDVSAYWEVFVWSWQIPVGFFVGTGLSWSIKDRQLSGVVAVDQRAVIHDQPLSETTSAPHP